MPDSKYKIGMLLQGPYCTDNYYLVTKVERSDESRSNKITFKGFTHNSCSDIQEDEELVDEAYAVLGNFGSDIFAKETERMFTAMYLTIHSSLKESFDKDLEKAKKELAENEKKLLAEIEDLKKERDHYKDAYNAVWDAVLNDPMIGGYSLDELECIEKEGE